MASLINTLAGRFLIQKSKGYSLNLGYTGEMQSGKSTFSFWNFDEICRIKNILDPKNWTENFWDYEKYCARSFDQFCNLVDQNNHKVIVVEEAGFDYGNLDWFKLQSKLFNKIWQTQAYKRNIYGIVLPHMLSFGKAHRHMINFLFYVEAKIEHRRISIVKPQYIKREYWKLKDDNLKQAFLNIITVQYSKDQLKRAKQYTNWLEGFKKEIMESIKMSAGITKKPLPELKKLDIEDEKPIKLKHTTYT